MSTSVLRRLAVMAVGWGLSLLPAALLAQEPARPVPGLDQKAAYAASQAVLGRTIGDHTLLDREGKPVRLSSFRGKPLLVSFIYTGCFQVCPATTRSLDETVCALQGRFGDNQFRPGLLAPLVNWQPGDAYHRNRLLRLQERLTQLDYFALVEVVPDEDGIGDDLQVPIDIRTTPARRTSYTGALSVGSDTGLGLRGAMNRRWVNDRGHKWLADAAWSQRRIEADTQYRVPSLGRLPGWWSGELGYLEEDPRIAAGFERTDLRLGWQGQRQPWALGGAVVFARETKVAAAQRSRGEPVLTLLYPEVTATWREVDDPLWPEQARQLTATVRGGLVEAAGRRERFLQFELGANWLQTLGESQRLVLRAAIGTTALDGDLDPQSFPTSLRYFAGGDRSIRGYGYHAIGPRIEGEVVGALHRVVASAEYQFDLTPQWGAALFVDAGDAFDSRHGFEARLGAGVGARWRSPVGLVAIDLARGLDEGVERGARAWLRRHDERVYSFVDATSFVVMRRERLGEALAFDGDFGAAGFVEVRPET